MSPNHPDPAPGHDAWLLAQPPRFTLNPGLFEPDARDPALAAQVAERFARARAANPALHDGPTLCVVGLALDAAPGAPAAPSASSAPSVHAHLAVQRGCYRHLVAQASALAPGLELGVYTLGVKGLILGADRAGRSHVLIARRAGWTRMYPGLWESAPAGGVTLDDDAISADPADVAHAVAATLAAEAHEELGLTIPPPALADARPVALVRDPAARSIDLFIRVRWPGVITPARPPGPCALPGRARANDAEDAEDADVADNADEADSPRDAGEYIDRAWLALADAARFDSPALAPPVRAAWRVLGWVGAGG